MKDLSLTFKLQLLSLFSQVINSNSDRFPNRTPTKTAHHFLFFSFLVLLSGCESNDNAGRFELNLLSSVFDDISINQGETSKTMVSIDREIEPLKFDPTIDMSLIDPPDWLRYTFEKNPVKGNTSTMSIDIDKQASPGIYRLVLQGVGYHSGKRIEDSVTFHLVVKKSLVINKQVLNEIVSHVP